MDLQDITYVASDGVGVITINRPEVMNAFRRQTQREVEDVLRAAEEDGVIVTVAVRFLHDHLIFQAVDCLGHGEGVVMISILQASRSGQSDRSRCARGDDSALALQALGDVFTGLHLKIVQPHGMERRFLDGGDNLGVLHAAPP